MFISRICINIWPTRDCFVQVNLFPSVFHAEKSRWQVAQLQRSIYGKKKNKCGDEAVMARWKVISLNLLFNFFIFFCCIHTSFAYYIGYSSYCLLFLLLFFVCLSLFMFVFEYFDCLNFLFVFFLSIKVFSSKFYWRWFCNIFLKCCNIFNSFCLKYFLFFILLLTNFKVILCFLVLIIFFFRKGKCFFLVLAQHSSSEGFAPCSGHQPVFPISSYFYIFYLQFFNFSTFLSAS